MQHYWHQTGRVFDWLACITARPKTARAHVQQEPIDESEIQIMSEQMLANRRIEIDQCDIKNAKTELKSAVGNNFSNRNLGLESNAEIA